MTNSGTLTFGSAVSGLKLVTGGDSITCAKVKGGKANDIVQARQKRNIEAETRRSKLPKLLIFLSLIFPTSLIVHRAAMSFGMLDPR